MLFNFRTVTHTHTHTRIDAGYHTLSLYQCKFLNDLRVPKLENSRNYLQIIDLDSYVTDVCQFQFSRIFLILSLLNSRCNYSFSLLVE